MNPNDLLQLLAGLNAGNTSQLQMGNIGSAPPVGGGMDGGAPLGQPPFPPLSSRTAPTLGGPLGQRSSDPSNGGFSPDALVRTDENGNLVVHQAPGAGPAGMQSGGSPTWGHVLQGFLGGLAHGLGHAQQQVAPAPPSGGMDLSPLLALLLHLHSGGGQSGAGAGAGLPGSTNLGDLSSIDFGVRPPQ